MSDTLPLHRGQSRKEDWLYTIAERESIFVKKELLGKKARDIHHNDWTKDEIFRNYKFCNVHRALDRTSRDLYAFKDKTDMSIGVLALLRFLCSDDMINVLRYSYVHDPNFKARFDALNRWDTLNDDRAILWLIKYMERQHRDNNVPLVSGAFIVKRYGNDHEQFTAVWRNAILTHKLLMSRAIKTSREACQNMMATYCVSDFSSYCMVSDWIELFPQYLDDLQDWCAFGPGAFNGVRFLFDTDDGKTKYLGNVQRALALWQANIKFIIEYIEQSTKLSMFDIDRACVENGYKPLSGYVQHPRMLDAEHWLCEYFKYERGNSKNRYTYK